MKKRTAFEGATEPITLRATFQSYQEQLDDLSPQKEELMKTMVENRNRMNKTLKSWKGKSKGALLAGILYVMSPLDLLPDYLPVIGWVDDLVVAILALN